jgi:Glycosyl hydrolase family 79, N-terminal domain
MPFASLGRIVAALAAATAAIAGAGRATAQVPTFYLEPSSLSRLGTIDERFQSYNVEMVEVTGGEFWKPYAASASAPASPDAAKGGTAARRNSDLFEYRSPIDLASPRLRTLAAALGPAYMRVSGTWANTTYFAESDRPPSTPPSGFTAVLSRERWKGVIDFANAVDTEIVTSMAVSTGVRDAAGRWQGDQARRFIAYTRSAGGRVAAAEFMNEPTLPAIGGVPKGYDAAAYGRDFKTFRALVKESDPDLIVLGPGSVGEATASSSSAHPRSEAISTRDILAASGAGIDAFSYHHYGAVSQRCSGIPGSTSAQNALSEDWLASTDQTRALYQRLRDEFEPGKPMWVTETAQAACGGDSWASTFLDSFRYLDQLGRLAKAGVQVVAHNTLAASDYGLLDEKTLRPRPNYWAALLWRRLMGATVLDAGAQHGTHIYAHCRRGAAGDVTLLVINAERTSAVILQLPLPSERYTLSAKHLQSAEVRLNGSALDLDPDDRLPRLVAVRSPAGSVELAPTTITFLTIADAGNAACK